MKKTSILLTILTSLSICANAQQRMVLYEEFTSDNNSSCATVNPPFWTLCNAGSNPSEMIQIAYMASLPPSADSFYYQDSAASNNRLNYYSPSVAYTRIGGAFAPSGFRDGLTPDVDSALPGSPAYFNQSDIDSEYANPSSFNLSVTNTWNVTYDSVYTTVTVSCVNAYNHPGANLMLRLALVENVDFTTPPGADGETHFQHVVRAMYPNASGTNVGGVWLLGANTTYSFVCAVPAYVNKAASPFMVAFLQNDSTQYVEQAGTGTPLANLMYDAGLNSTTGPGLVCAPNGTYNAASSVLLQNNGTATLTTATIYYSLDGGASSTYAWTGSLATGANVNVTMPAIPVTVTGAGSHTIWDSVAMPDGWVDYATADNVSQTSFFIESTTALSMPYTTGFESGRNQFYSDNITTTDSEQWEFYNSTTAAHRGSYAATFHCFNFQAGDVAILTLPEVSLGIGAHINFYVSYAEFSSTAGTFGDTLDVVYSTDCGTTWNTIWSANGAGLATVGTDSNFYMPTDSANYSENSVEPGSIPSGSMIGFRAHSGYGNNIWLDDINIVNDLGISQNDPASNISVSPNPAYDELQISEVPANADFTLTNMLGSVIMQGNLQQGSNQIAINGLIPGIYTLQINTITPNGNNQTIRKIVKE